MLRKYDILRVENAPDDESRLNLIIKQKTDSRVVQGLMAQALIRNKSVTTGRKEKQRAKVVNLNALH